MASKSKFYYTLLGFLTIIIWGTSAIFTRNLSTGLGAYTSAALVNLIGGIVVLVTQLIKKEGLTGIPENTGRYVEACSSYTPHPPMYP